MAEWMLDNAFECPHGFVQDYNDCKYQHREECTECERWKRILAEKVYLKYLLNEYGVDCLWISVKDRLPEITEKNTLGEITMSKYVITAIKTKEGSSYVTFNVFAKNNYTSVMEWIEPLVKTDDVVTHWMPLPEPPKEG